MHIDICASICYNISVPKKINENICVRCKHENHDGHFCKLETSLCLCLQLLPRKGELIPPSRIGEDENATGTSTT